MCRALARGTCYHAPMRLMGIDYGAKRVGVALSDVSGAMAFPHATYENDTVLISRIVSLAKEKDVGTIVVGKSHDLKNAPNPVQKDVEVFTAALANELSVPVVSEPEQFTTQAALRIQGRTDKTDASAAALILDSYIIRQKKDL